MTDTVLCQSVLSAVRGPEPCQHAASRVLFGVHLCGSHDNHWRQRVATGEKIRIHPERALPLDHRCAPPTVGRRCPRCGQDKPLNAFYDTSGANHNRWCRECTNAWHRDYRERERAALSTEQPPSPAPAGTPRVITPTSIAPPRPSYDPTAPSRVGQYVYIVEFTCSLCSRWVCDVEVSSRNAVALPKTAMCPVVACGGSAQRSGEVRQKYIGPTGAAFWDATSYEGSAWAADEDLAS
jgi:hypothetical protein